MSSRPIAGIVVLFLLDLAGVPKSLQAQKPAPVQDVSTFPHRSPAEERKALHVPPGFEVQLVAAEPDIQKPLNLAFDDRGRLWVTDTVEYPYPAKPGTKPRDTVKILSDFGPDGRARSVRTFADGLNIPIGLLPLPSASAALVHSIPDIFLLRDSDGDGRADSREVLYGVYGHQDTHGMTNAFTWGFDGWVYACHGYANDSTVKGKDGRPIVMNSGNTYRMRADGSHAEYFAHGQVNPFGLSFDPLGNLYSCDCHSRPVYQLLRGAWYPSFGKPHDGLGFGPEMVSHDHGSTGIAGISYYAADQFPQAYRGTVFIGNVVTNRINHDRVEWHGSTPRGIEQPDFVWSEDNWFRPVDIELGPDGALYVADFYNRIIGHYEVPLTHPGRDRTSGRIWRIVYRGGEGMSKSSRAGTAGGQDPLRLPLAKGESDVPPPLKRGDTGGFSGASTPRGADGKLPPPPGSIDRTRSTAEQLCADLSSPNLAVRISAANQLVERIGQAAVPQVRALLGDLVAPAPKVSALWVLHRLGALDDEMLLRAACDPEVAPRVHAMKVLAERPTLASALHTEAIRRLTDDDAFVRRAAAEALGAHPGAANIRPLLALRQAVAPDDTHLLHVVRMALRDQLKSPAAWSAVAGMDLSPRDLADVADVATGVPSAESAAFLLKQLESTAPGREDQERFLHHVARHGAAGSVPRLMALVRSGDRPPAERLALLRSIQQGVQESGRPLDPAVRDLAVTLCRGLLASRDAAQAGLGIEAARELQAAELLPALNDVVARRDFPDVRRSEALQALAAIDPARGVEMLRDILKAAPSSLELREAAAIALANLDRPEARAAVLDALGTAPQRLQSTIAAALARRADGAKALLAAIEAGKASARLLQERRVVIGLENAEIPRLSERLSALLQGLPPADQKIRELIDARRRGYEAAGHDPARGAKVFEQKCGICHQLDGKGAKVGPQLEGIGSRGLDRLLEDVLDPNRNVDQSFRVTNLALENGQVVSGLLLREEGEVLVVADAQGKEIRVPKSSVEERSTAQLSPMPANLADQLTEPELRDLMAFLLRHREEKPVR
jgi:putative heme-binding domain-containing protein